MALSFKNVAKLGSKDRMYLRLFSQAAMDEMLSLVVRDHSPPQGLYWFKIVLVG